MKTLKEFASENSIGGRGSAPDGWKDLRTPTEFTKSNSAFPRALPWAGIYKRLRRFGESNMYLPLGEGIKTVPPSKSW
jgi:hypothetical protein